MASKKTTAPTPAAEMATEEIQSEMATLVENPFPSEKDEERQAELTHEVYDREAAEATPTEQLIKRNMAPADIRRTREELTISRAGMAELTGLSLSRVWASEQDAKDISDEHYAVIIAALARVREHGLPEHLQPKNKKATTASVPLDRLSALVDLLNTAHSAKTLKDVKAAVEQAQALLASLSA